MSAWEDVLLDSGDQRKPAEWWWAYVVDTDPLRIRRELETTPIGSTPSTLIAGLEIGDKVRVVNYLGQALIVGRAGGSRPQRWPGAPFAEAAGIVSVTGTGSDRASVNVTFPAGRFTEPPLMFADVEISPGSNPVMVANGYNASAASFSIRLVRADGTFSGSYPVRWHAVQMTPTSASG